MIWVELTFIYNWLLQNSGENQRIDRKWLEECKADIQVQMDTLRQEADKLQKDVDTAKVSHRSLCGECKKGSENYYQVSPCNCERNMMHVWEIVCAMPINLDRFHVMFLNTVELSLENKNMDSFLILLCIHKSWWISDRIVIIQILLAFKVSDKAIATYNNQDYRDQF